ncbi:hypothetical protein Q3G72_033566 [Acer saccharum]|nr:hypothetical protein Q3G72_015454 [Acer saccharum]KAK1572492.1 hypothetical protein Q3G72_033566 [Acer saccharum]
MSHLSSQATIAFVHKEKGDSLNTNNILEQKNGSEMPRSAKACDSLNTNNIHEQRNGSKMPTSANLVYTHHSEVYDCNHDQQLSINGSSTKVNRGHVSAKLVR